MKLKTLFFSAAVILISLQTFSQVPGIFRSYYTGELDDGRLLQMDIVKDLEMMSGYYTIKEETGVFSYTGSYYNDGTFKLHAFTSEEEEAGTFTGTITDPDFISGKYYDIREDEEYSFELNLTAEYVIVQEEENGIDLYAEYPKFVINSVPLLKLGESIGNDVLAVFENFLREQKHLLEQDAGLNEQYYIEYYVDAAYYSEEFLSLYIDKTSFTGGTDAEINFGGQSYVIEGKSFRPVGLSHLFDKDEDYTDVLSGIIIDDLIEQEADMVVDGTIKEFKESGLMSFTVYSSFIRFNFAPLTVSKFTALPYFVDIPLEDIEGIVNEDGPLEELLD